MSTKTKPGFASLTSSEDDEIQEYIPEIQSVELLTKNDPMAIPSGRKTPLDEYVMVGIRLTKRQRKALKMLAADMDLSIQETVRRAIVMFRDAQGFHK